MNPGMNMYRTGGQTLREKSMRDILATNTGLH